MTEAWIDVDLCGLSTHLVLFLESMQGES